MIPIPPSPTSEPSSQQWRRPTFDSSASIGGAAGEEDAMSAEQLDAMIDGLERRQRDDAAAAAAAESAAASADAPLPAPGPASPIGGLDDDGVGASSSANGAVALNPNMKSVDIYLNSDDGMPVMNYIDVDAACASYSGELLPAGAPAAAPPPVLSSHYRAHADAADALAAVRRERARSAAATQAERAALERARAALTVDAARVAAARGVLDDEVARRFERRRRTREDITAVIDDRIAGSNSEREPPQHRP